MALPLAEPSSLASEALRSAAANCLDRGDSRDFITGDGGAVSTSGLREPDVIRRVSLSHSVTQRAFEQAGMEHSHSIVR